MSGFSLTKQAFTHGTWAHTHTPIKIFHSICFPVHYKQAFRDGLDTGTFREGLEGLRSDLVNKAVQHRALAKNISSDVLEPLTELRGQLSSKTRALVSERRERRRETPWCLPHVVWVESPCGSLSR